MIALFHQLSTIVVQSASVPCLKVVLLACMDWKEAGGLYKVLALVVVALLPVE